MAGNRALGLGLVAGGGVLGAIMLLWLVVSLAGRQLTGGGAVLGLFLLAVLALPLIGGGLYVLSRGKQEAAAAAEFQTQRRTLESDRLFRAEQARELGQLARRLEALGRPEAAQLAGRLRDLVQDLENPAYDSAAFYEAVALGRADTDALDRYDALLSDGARAMADVVDRLEGGPGDLGELRQAIQNWERDERRRAELLRGRRASAVAPTDLLRAGPPAASAEAVATLKVGDAVSRDGEDYLIETSVSYFAGGRTTWLHRLASGREEAWLYVSPGALSLAWLRAADVAGEPGASPLPHAGATCRLEESGVASAEVRGRGGQQAAGTVSTWRYRCDDGRLLWLERWSDRSLSYSGTPIRPSDLEIWPSEAKPAEAG